MTLKLRETAVKACIHNLDPRACWCPVRYGDAGLINGQRVDFRGEKVLTFPSMRGIMRMPPTGNVNFFGPTPAFDGRGAPR